MSNQRYIELTDESRGRILFSTVVPDMTRETFLEFWRTLGTYLYEEDKRTETGGYMYYRVRVTTITH
jgi:hypothetical protein